MTRSEVLITGGTGFVGSHVVDRFLAAGHPVRALVRTTSSLRWLEGKNVRRIVADLREPRGLDAAVEGVGTILHFGGEIRSRGSADFVRSNAEGTGALARAFARILPDSSKGTFVYCSSLSAGGPAPDLERRPFRFVCEEDPPRPVSDYGWSKLEGERRLGVLSGKARVVVLRPPAVYGPRDPSVLRLFRWIRRGLLPLPSRGGNLLSLISVMDLAEAAYLSATVAGARGTYYVSDGRVHTWEDVGTLAAEIMGVRARVVRIPSPAAWAIAAFGEIGVRLGAGAPLLSFGKVREMRQKSWVCFHERASRDFGYQPHVKLREGLGETIRWYQDSGWLRNG
jgi:nucleoside-diphosphate-sugar epimerase